MADKPQAKNELGKLFVDIGIGGLGKTLKGLNSVAASFLLGKNAAVQFAKTMTEPFKQAGNAAIGIGKMSNALATSSLEYQKFAMYLKKYKVSDGLMGDVQKMMSTFKAYQEGVADLPEGMAYIQSKLHLPIDELSGSFEEVLWLMDQMYDKTKGMSKLDRNFLYQRLGVSDEWGYLGDQGGRAGDYITISDEAVRQNQQLAQKMEELRNTTENLIQETLARMAPALSTIADKLTQWEKDFSRGDGLDKTLNTAGGSLNAAINSNKFESFLGGVVPGYALGKVLEGGIKGYNKSNSQLAEPPKELPTGMAANVGYLGTLPDIEKSAEIPPNIGNMVQNITNNISHDITINGGNPNEIANQIASISAQDIEYAQYQIANLPGI